MKTTSFFNKGLVFLFCVLVGTVHFSCKKSPGNGMGPGVEAEGSPRIDIVVEGMQEGVAFLLGTLNGQRYKSDSSHVNSSGELRFERENPYTQGHFLVYLPDKTSFQLLLGPDQEFSMKTVAGDLIAQMEVDGNVDNELFYESMKYEMDIQPQVDGLTQRMARLDKNSPEYAQMETSRTEIMDARSDFLEGVFRKYPDSFFTSFKRSGQNPDIKTVRNPDGTVNTRLQVYYYKKEFWDNVNFKDERLLYTPVIINKANRYMKELTVQHQDSIIKSASELMQKVDEYPEYFKFFANWITLQFEPGETTLMDGEAVYVHMIKNYFTRNKAFWADSMTVYGLQQRAAEMQASLVGLQGPNVEAKDPNGGLKSIYEIDSPYIVIYMFNPKCEHCMEETPKLVNFYQKWRSRGVEVFAIGVDTTEEEWKEYIDEHNMSWVNVFDPTNRSIYGKYFVDKTPEIYVLNQDRIIIAKNLKVFQISDVINRDQS